MSVTALRLLIAVALLLSLPSCLIVCSAPIQGDAQADPALEGDWKITSKTPDEIKSDRDEADVGSARIVLRRLDTQTYEVTDYDKEGDPEPTHYKVTTRKYEGNQFLIVHPTAEAKTKEEKELKNAKALIDYHVDGKGCLFLRYLHIEDLAEIEKAHPMKYDFSGDSFAPVILKGSERQVLDLYADPKVRTLLTSCGKYRKASDRAK